jgi:flavin reductase (DIM6/NTAB) family NADH-FMN oxidoreductase RutF
MTSQNPFLPPPEDREPNRRLRGRLAAPVTLVTAGSGSARAGLTVSSLFVNEGDPGEIHMVIGPVTDLWDVLADTGRCVVHIAEARHRAWSDVFAGLRPNPGGIFAGIDTRPSEWGPVLADLPNRAYCRVERMEERGWSGVVIATIDRVEISDLDEPLIHFRGAYHRLG